MPEPVDTTPRRSAPTLELLWQDDTSALALVRDADGRLTADGLALGAPAGADLSHVGPERTRGACSSPSSSMSSRTVICSAAAPGDVCRPRARPPFARRRARPPTPPVGRRPLARTLGGNARRGRAGRARRDLGRHAGDLHGAVDGDADAFVYDLYGCALDELARRALSSVGLRAPGWRDAAPERFLATLHADDPTLPANAGYTALERRLSAWVDGGLDRRSRAPWNVGLRLDELDDGIGPSRVLVELWLQAADDPTLALPASLLHEGGEEVFTFLREGDPHAAIRRRLETIHPILADAGIPLLDEELSSAELDNDQVRALLSRAVPRLEELAVPVHLPRAWVASTSRVRVNLVAEGTPMTSSGLLTRDAIASFDWRLAVGDVELTDEELAELAAAKEPLIRLRGRWHALRASDVERALRFLERRSATPGMVELVRAIAGLETDEAGVELGEVRPTWTSMFSFPGQTIGVTGHSPRPRG